MTKSPGSWFSLLWTYISITKGMTEAFVVKLKHYRDADKQAHL